MTSLFYVFVGGGMGSICRFAINECFTEKFIAIGTFSANIISCLILGVLVGLAGKGLLTNQYRLLLVTGFCGGFSTFSSYGGDIISLYQQGQWVISLAYLFLSIIAGILSIILGIALVRLFNG